MNHIIPTIILSIICCCNITYADNKSGSEGNADDIVNVIVADEIESAHKDLLLWEDQKVIEKLSKITVNDEYIKKLYSKFKSTIVNPPNPDTYKEYGISNGEESLVKVTKLGKEIHNLGLVMSDSDFERYGEIIHIMRDVLYLDSKCIPLAIKHDNSRDVYWYELHNKWLENAEDAYNKIFNQAKPQPNP